MLTITILDMLPYMLHLPRLTGADKTWVSTEFADKLDLPQGKPIQKSVAIFASTGVIDIKAYPSILSIKLRNSERWG